MVDLVVGRAISLRENTALVTGKRPSGRARGPVSVAIGPRSKAYELMVTANDKQRQLLEQARQAMIEMIGHVGELLRTGHVQREWVEQAQSGLLQVLDSIELYLDPSLRVQHQETERHHGNGYESGSSGKRGVKGHPGPAVAAEDAEERGEAGDD